MSASANQESATSPTEYVLGLSGLPLAYEFRKRALEALEPLTEAEIRMCQGMDSAAAILHQGKVIAAAEEERFNRQPHTHHFPSNAITYCLKQAGINIRNISAITHGFDYGPYAKFYSQDSFSRNRYEQTYAPTANAELFATYFPEIDVEHRYQPVAHHHAHAASAYYPSDFNDALVLIIDAMGEYYSTSVFSAQNNVLKVLRQYDLLSSLGIFYSLITLHLGFRPNADEYKVMGLAPYGDPQRFLKPLEQCIQYRENGAVFFPIYLRNRNLISKETFRDSRQWFAETLIPARIPGEELTQDHSDLAAALQEVLSRSIFHMLRYWCSVTPHRKLCIAGGVGFNCTINGEILRSGLVDDLYVPPAAGDAGVSVGSALYHYYKNNPAAPRYPGKLPFYGPTASEEDIHSALTDFAQGLVVRPLDQEKLIQEVVSLINSGKVVAWMQGSMEFGPRALGNRSILADPRRPDMKDIINQKVKKREAFRPFAPSVKLEEAHTYFDIPPGQEHPYMLTTVQVRSAFQRHLPAVTHVDGSARLQTVHKEDHPIFWLLLDEFQQQTGFPILLNTSFNVAGESIVCTAQDALKTFISSGLDALGIGNYLVLKPDEH